MTNSSPNWIDYAYTLSKTPTELLDVRAWEPQVDEAEIARREQKARRGDIATKVALWSWLAMLAGGLTGGAMTMSSHPNVAVVFVAVVVGLLGIALLAIVGVVLFVLGGE